MTTTDYKREIIPFTTEADWLKARAKDITSTDSASLFGMGRHTYAELYYMKKEGVQVEFKENDSIKWGRRNEPLIAEGLAEDHKLTIRKYKDYVRIASLRIGSSFDYLVQRDGREVPFEIKSVKARFKKEWFDEYGDVQCPLHIEFQLEWEMLVFGSDICALGVKFDSDDAHLVWRKSK